MRQSWLCGCAVLLGLTLINVSASFGDDKDAAPEKQTVKKVVAAESAKTVAKPMRPRLPRMFGKLRLSPDQVDKLKAVGEKYQKQIKELQTKISELQKQQSAEQHAILDEAQKSQLAELKEKAEKAAAARKAAKAGADSKAEAQKK